MRPKDYKELYNLRHAQLRNAIERIFGVVKRRFHILSTAPEYGFETQAKLVQAICVVHNVIRIYDPLDLAQNMGGELQEGGGEDKDIGYGQAGRAETQKEREESTTKRDEIVRACGFYIKK